MRFVARAPDWADVVAAHAPEPFPPPRVDTGEAVLRYELLEEQAAALGRTGRKLEAALMALEAHQGEGRGEVLKAAADAAWCFFVQREVLGLRDRAAIVAQYRIPREVMVRIGAR